MPLNKCTIDNQDGYKWGEQGKCYVGKDAKEKAIAQGVAIGDYNLESYNDYPESAKNNAKRALKWVEANGWGTCGGDAGIEWAQRKLKEIDANTNLKQALSIAKLANLKK
jgi:hypothetical protein